MLTDAEALLAAIAAFPDEDTPRLMYADEIEGTEPERAEFIRVQCEWSNRRHAPRCCSLCTSELNETPYESPGCEYCSTRLKQVALLAAHRREWLTVPCERCGGAGWEGLQADGSVKYNCPDCNGTGDAGGLTWNVRYEPPIILGEYRLNDEPVRAKFARGFPFRVTVPQLADVFTSGYTEYGIGPDAPTRWLVAVCRCYPVTEVVCSDREPFQYLGRVYIWHQAEPCSGRHPDSRDEVPAPLLTENVVKTHLSRESAITALARAVVTFARTFSGPNVSPPMPDAALARAIPRWARSFTLPV